MENVTSSSGSSSVLRYKRLRRGSYFADFRRDKRLNPEVYHCIIQREGSQRILSWTQHRTLEAAIQVAEEELDRLTKKDDGLSSELRRTG